jgi:hypothetical protein
MGSGEPGQGAVRCLCEALSNHEGFMGYFNSKRQCAGIKARPDLGWIDILACTHSNREQEYALIQVSRRY